MACKELNDGMLAMVIWVGYYVLKAPLLSPTSLAAAWCRVIWHLGTRLFTLSWKLAIKWVLLYS